MSLNRPQILSHIRPAHRALSRAGPTGIGRPRKRGDRDPETLGGACAAERPANGTTCGSGIFRTVRLEQGFLLVLANVRERSEEPFTAKDSFQICAAETCRVHNPVRAIASFA